MKDIINVFIHRRDFRLDDNAALNKLSDTHLNVPTLHVFIFNPVQINPEINKFYNKNCVEFMIQSLKCFKNELKDALYFFNGTDVDVLTKIMKSFIINAVAWNTDYTPFARSRDTYLKNWCGMKKIDTVITEDYSLFEMGSILTNNNKPYEVFTPFYKKCLKNYEFIPKPHTSKNVLTFRPKTVPGCIKSIDKFYNNDPNIHLKVKGGRDLALAILKRVKLGEFKHYDKNRDIPAIDKTTKLAAYIKFGCVSARETFHAFLKNGLNNGLIRELLWREFYAHATWHFPKVFEKPFKYIDIKWVWKKEWYDKIMSSKTGFPIVDAAIKELKTTGWINNRLRMIVASFITKDLAMDWRIFERDLFGRYLVDYDPSTNCHSWQGIAGVGIDSAPYWRIMNPWRQIERFDKELVYIKRWLPEFANAATVQKWRSDNGPMVDHDEQVKKYLALFADMKV